MGDQWQTQPNAALRDEAARLLEENYLYTHSAWAEGHLALLCELRAAVGNDLDKVIIMGAIGQRMMKAVTTTASSYGELAQGHYELDESLLTNIESISASSGIPRESVRRKVMELVETGWVGRNAGGRLWIQPEGTSALEKCTAIELGFISNMIAKLIGIMGMTEASPMIVPVPDLTGR
jgi:hypothetical protein